MSFPDYGLAVERVGKWIADTVKLEPGKTAFLEPSLPEAPDRLVSIFEVGGQWNEARNLQDWTLLMVTRAATLKEARALAIASIRAALNGFRTSAPAARDGIRALRLNSLPKLLPREDRNRVLLETTFIMSVNAAGDFGVDQ